MQARGLTCGQEKIVRVYRLGKTVQGKPRPTLQLIEVLDIWTDAIDIGHLIDVVYCDFMKAFNRAPHKRLIEKLQTTALRATFFAGSRVSPQGRDKEYK